jgi:hypothetical protein
MCCVLGTLIAGTVASGVGRGAVSDRARLRPALRGLVKTGILAKRKIEAAGTAVAQEAKKIVNEARQELEHAGTE